MDLISVIIPVYNVEAYLCRCVESVLAQTYPNLEIILVDDGSPDRSGVICDELMTRDSRIKVVHKENGGLGFARNSGLELATGKYVTFVDSDDWISDTHIENLHRAASTHHADAVIGSHTMARMSGSVEPRKGKLKEGLYADDAIIQKIVLPIIGPDSDFSGDIQVEASSCMNLYRMAVILDNELRFISEKYAVAEDYFFNIDFLCCSKCVYALNEVGYFYYENPGSISRKYDPKRFGRTLNFYSEIKQTVKKWNLTDQIAFRADRTFLMKIRVAIRHIVLSKLSVPEQIREIGYILSNETVEGVLREYPIETYGYALRLLTQMMRSGNALGVYCLMQIRELVRRGEKLKQIIKRVEICGLM